MRNIILIAPPAAGKGTQSQMICEKYQIPHISTGDLLRDEAKKETKLLTKGLNIISQKRSATSFKLPSLVYLSINVEKVKLVILNQWLLKN